MAKKVQNLSDLYEHLLSCLYNFRFSGLLQFVTVAHDGLEEDTEGICFNRHTVNNFNSVFIESFDIDIGSLLGSLRSRLSFAGFFQSSQKLFVLDLLHDWNLELLHLYLSLILLLPKLRQLPQ
jgi:hypothetical protein